MARTKQTSDVSIYWPLRTALASGGVIASLLGAHLLAQANPPPANPPQTVTTDINPNTLLATPFPVVEVAPLMLDLPPIPTVASPRIGSENTAPPIGENTAVSAPPPLTLELDLAPIPTLAPPPPAPVAPPPQAVVTQSNSSR